MKNTDRYNLYLIDPDNIKPSEKHYLITAQYCLLYTKNRYTKKCIKITDMNKLPVLAREWLNSCINEIRIEYLAQNQEEILENAESYVKRLRQELEIERKGTESEGV